MGPQQCEGGVPGPALGTPRHRILWREEVAGELPGSLIHFNTVLFFELVFTDVTCSVVLNLGNAEEHLLDKKDVRRRCRFAYVVLSSGNPLLLEFEEKLSGSCS